MLYYDSLLLGPLLTYTLHKLGAWKFALAGGVLTCGGAIGTSFASEFWHAIVSFSIVQGMFMVLETSSSYLLPLGFGLLN